MLNFLRGGTGRSCRYTQFWYQILCWNIESKTNITFLKIEILSIGEVLLYIGAFQNFDLYTRPSENFIFIEVSPVVLFIKNRLKAFHLSKTFRRSSICESLSEMTIHTLISLRFSSCFKRSPKKLN